MLGVEVKKMSEENECEVCKKLRKDLTWVGDPPKCRKHKTLIDFTKYIRDY